ncbi:rhodanese-like domain-containing protein [Ferruginibacter sp.]
MKTKYLLMILLQIAIATKAQYKNDDVLYKTVDPRMLYKTLQSTKDYVLLDVRSKGEYEDTSQFAGANIGRLKGAVNIPVNELGKRLDELQQYKGKPVFVYCSHSQRSRRASKMLADSGFSNVMNVNGGLTSLLYFSETSRKEYKELYENRTGYSFISPKELCDKVNKNAAAVFLLDVRSDSLFRHIALQPKENALGTIRGSVNIPYEKLKEDLSAIPRNKDIVLVDVYDDDAARTAALLLKNGYKNVQVLIEGMDRWVAMNEVEVPCKKILYQPVAGINIIAATEFLKEDAAKKYTIIDVRTDEEYNNTHKDYWRNIGKIKNAVHLPWADMQKDITLLEPYKNKPVLLYHFGGDRDVFAAADYLSSKGFTDVTVLYGGIFNLRWTAANIKGQAALKDYVTDIPEINK